MASIVFGSDLKLESWMRLNLSQTQEHQETPEIDADLFEIRRQRRMGRAWRYWTSGI